MTRARALKKSSVPRRQNRRRYTTARRHILRELNAPQAPPAPQAPRTDKGGLSDAKAIEKTGHDLAYWFDVMDRLAASRKATPLTGH
jgi:hypothetical protein